jgi:hypothetical protein
MKISTYFILSVFVLLIFASCGKKSEDAKPLSKKELVSKSIWTLEKSDYNITIAGGLIPVPDSLQQNPLQSFVGGTMEFKADGTLIATPKSGGTPFNGKWELIENDTKIRFKDFLTGGNGGEELPIDPAQREELEKFTIVQLTEKNFDLTNNAKFNLPAPGLPIPIEVAIKSGLNLVPKK